VRHYVLKTSRDNSIVEFLSNRRSRAEKFSKISLTNGQGSRIQIQKRIVKFHRHRKDSWDSSRVLQREAAKDDFLLIQTGLWMKGSTTIGEGPRFGYADNERVADKALGRFTYLWTDLLYTRGAHTASCACGCCTSHYERVRCTVDRRGRRGSFPPCRSLLSSRRASRSEYNSRWIRRIRHDVRLHVRNYRALSAWAFRLGSRASVGVHLLVIQHDPPSLHGMCKKKKKDGSEDEALREVAILTGEHLRLLSSRFSRQVSRLR